MTDTVEAPAGLKRALSSRQIAMMAIGSAIGTGLFLGSGLAISFAGPAVIVAYVIGAVVALAVAYALAEMTVAHPEAAGFGAIAARYLGPGAGFVQRWIYWSAVVVNIGAEVTAAGIYVQFWWPGVPLWVPAVGFSVLMLIVNVLSVRFFGEFEFWFAMIKVVTIVLFVLLGVVAIVTGLPGHPATGVHAVTAYGGFLPNGIGGIWLALTVVTFSYLGTEAVAVAAGESKNPQRDIPRAARSMVLRLGLFYILAIAVVVAIVPWTQTAKANGVTESPFVQLFTTAGVPAAAAIMNFVVLTAALSAMNSNLYVGSRMVHSLALDNMAPRWLAAVSSRGVPVRSLGLSAAGLALAIGISLISPDNAFAALVGLALFGALVTWLLIFATLLAFRRRRAAEGHEQSLVRLRGGPVPVVLAMIFLVAVIVTTAFTPQFGIVLPAGVPYLVLLCLGYLVVRTILRSREKLTG